MLGFGSRFWGLGAALDLTGPKPAKGSATKIDGLGAALDLTGPKRIGHVSLGLINQLGSSVRFNRSKTPNIFSDILDELGSSVRFNRSKTRSRKSGST